MKCNSLLASFAVLGVVCVAGACSSSDKDPEAVGGSPGSGGSGAAGAPASGGAAGGEQGGAAGQGGNGAAGGSAGAAGAGAGGEGGGGLPPAPTAILCPEANPFSPKNENSVSVQGVVMSEDQHWTADKVYLIGDDFKVKGHTLTIDAGTVICLYNTAQIFVGEGIEPGEIHLNGTADKHITITAVPDEEDPTKPDAYHRGIKFDTYLNSTLSYVDIWYGGRGGGSGAWAFELQNTAHGTDAKKPLLVDHLFIGEVQTKGFRVGTPLGVAPESAIRFTGFAPPSAGDPALGVTAGLNLFAVKSVTAALTYDKPNIPEAAQAIHLETAAPPLRLEGDAQITDAGLPYWYRDSRLTIAAPDDETSATLTIDAGVTIHMSGQIRVGDNHEGNLVLAGTAEKPVILTSGEATPAPGDWEGIAFLGSFFDPTKSKIEHAQILYAGIDVLQSSLHIGRCGDDFAAALEIFGLGSYDGPAISNTLIAHSLSNGIASVASDSGAALTNDYSDASLKITFDDIAKENLVIGPCP